MAGEPVLVTGGSGFVATYCIAALLDAGHAVRTTVRSAARADDVRATLATAGVDPGDALAFSVADLREDAGWREAVDGCSHVLHVASPFPAIMPRDPDELIVPARDGALRVLRAAREAGAGRVVMTSSVAAVAYGLPIGPAPFTEESWTDVRAPGVGAYHQSKTLAEQAAWEYVRADDGGPDLAVVNPVGVLGPVLGPDYATSILIVQRLLAGRVPGIPNFSLGLVDVRDVADLHLRAMTHPAAPGERFIATAGPAVSVAEVATILREHLGPAARRVPTRRVPDWSIRVAARFDRQVDQVVHELGIVRDVSAEKARTLLGWSPRSAQEAILATAESLLRLGLVRP